MRWQVALWMAYTLCFTGAAVLHAIDGDADLAALCGVCVGFGIGVIAMSLEESK